MRELLVSEVAEQAGVTERYVQAEIERGNLKARRLKPDKPRSDWMIDPKSFAEWMKRRSERQAAQA